MAQRQTDAGSPELVDGTRAPKADDVQADADALKHGGAVAQAHAASGTAGAASNGEGTGGHRMGPTAVLALQRGAGNAAVAGLMRRPATNRAAASVAVGVQRDLLVMDDPVETEAPADNETTTDTAPPANVPEPPPPPPPPPPPEQPPPAQPPPAAGGHAPGTQTPGGAGDKTGEVGGGSAGTETDPNAPAGDAGGTAPPGAPADGPNAPAGPGGPGGPNAPAGPGGTGDPNAPAGAGAPGGVIDENGRPAPPPPPPPPPPRQPPRVPRDTPPPQRGETPPPAAPRRQEAGGPPAGDRGGPEPPAPANQPAPNVAPPPQLTNPPPAPAPNARGAAGPAPGRAPAPDTADPGINWSEVADILIPPGRTVLELGRFIPGIGGVTGMLSDVAGAYSDLTSVPQNDTGDLVSDLIVVRSCITVVNGALGHLLYVNQLVQDGLAGSVVGAEFTPLTAALNETLSTVKIFLDIGNGFVDVLVEAGAQYGRDHASSPEERDKWQGLVDGYAANIAGDVVGLIMDCISLASVGAANTGPAQEAVRIFNLSGAILKSWGPNLVALLGGIWNVWGGNIIKWVRDLANGEPSAPSGNAPSGSGSGGGTRPGGSGGSGAGGGQPGGQPAQRMASGDLSLQLLGEGGAAAMALAESVALDAAGGIVDTTGASAQGAYMAVNGVIDLLAEYADQKMAEIDQVVMAIGDGRTSFELIRDAVASTIETLNMKLETVTSMVAAAGSAENMAQQVREYCDGAVASIDAIEMPQVTIPEVDLGEGLIAGAAESLVNEAAALANDALRGLIGTVNGALAEAKSGLKEPILEMKGHADAFGEFMANVIEIGTQQSATVSQHLATFSEGLGQCQNVEQVINLIISQISSIMGTPSFTVQDLRDLWGEVGVAIDDYAALGPQMHQAAAAARAEAARLAALEDTSVQTEPELVAPGAGPDDEDDENNAAVG